MEYLCHKNDHGYVPLFENTCRSFPHSWLITEFITILTGHVPLVEQELPTLLDHLSSHSVFSRIRVTLSVGSCVCFVDRCLSFCTFSSLFLPLCCLFFFYIRFLIIHLVSSNSSCKIHCIILNGRVYQGLPDSHRTSSFTHNQNA